MSTATQAMLNQKSATRSVHASRWGGVLVWALCLGAPAAAQGAGSSSVELRLSLAHAELASDSTTTLTFELINNSTNLLTSVDISIDWLDAAGASALTDFVIGAPQLTGIGDVAGSPIFASLGPGATATASFAVTPLASAAATGTQTFTLNSSVAGVLEGAALVRSMPVQSLRVLPAPRLELELYWPATAHGDWSSTAAIFEPQEPFSVGAVIRNTGAGTAFDVSLVSPGPMFAADAFGASLFAQVLDLEVDGLTTAGGFSLPPGQLGDLAPGAERRILWTAGTNFEAGLVSLPVSLFVAGALVQPASLTSESLVHVAEAFETAAGPLDDGLIDWLVDEPGVAAPLDPLTGISFTEFPSVIRSSDGSDLTLLPQVNPTIGLPPTTLNLMSTATITTGGPGWNYLRFDDPGGALFALAGVTRTQKALHLGGLSVGGPGDVSRVWTTERPIDLTADGVPDIVRREIHVVDFVPTAGNWEYALAYVESAAAALVPDIEVLSAQTGGVQNLTLDAGPGHAGEVFILLGSLSGTMPGTPVDQALLPLNVDGYFIDLLTNPGLQALFGSIGVLDAQGGATAQIQVPAGFAVGSGLAVNHAFLTLPAAGPITFASNAALLFVLP